MEAPYSRPGPATIVVRWLFGTALISWRYMWQITPLHRSESIGDTDEDTPPRLPPSLVDETVQPAEHGVGALFHRRFDVRITGARCTAESLIGEVVHDFRRFVPREVVDIRTSVPAKTELTVGDELVVTMPGPWDGPVRVVHRDRNRLRLVTLRGHLEAGQVQFEARSDGADLVFTVEAWARPSTRVVWLLYCHLRLAKEIQLNMWVRFCRSAAAVVGGHLVDGVAIRTHRLRPSALRRAGVIPTP